MNLHYHFKKNKKVFLILKDGTQIIDRWLGTKRKNYVLKEFGEIRICSVRAISIFHNHKATQI